MRHGRHLHWTPSRGFLLCLVCIAIGVAPLPAPAEHEEDHRYTVKGYLLAADDSPIAAATVTIRAGSAGGRAETDGAGYYSARLHLHNEDLGKPLRVTTDHGGGEVRVTFDPADRNTPRVHHVNIIAGKLVEGPLTRAGGVPSWLYYLVGAALLVMIVAFLRQPLKRLTRRQRTPAEVKAVRGTGKTRPRQKRRKRR